LNISPSQPNSY